MIVGMVPRLLSATFNQTILQSMPDNGSSDTERLEITGPLLTFSLTQRLEEEWLFMVCLHLHEPAVVIMNIPLLFLIQWSYYLIV
jgi:hypothetical protein